MPLKRDEAVAIVGGGIIGMTAAWRLAQAGFPVTVFDKSAIGGEASWAGAGMLAPGGEFEEDSLVTRLALESRGMYPAFVSELQRESGLQIDLQETGALDVAFTRAEMAGLEARATKQLALGIASKRMKPEQITTFWPRLRKEELVGGYFYGGDSFVDPRQVVAALRRCCEKAGVEIRDRQAIRGIAVDDAGVCVDGGRYRFCVMASGAWSGFIAVSGVPALPWSEPVRGHLLGYQQPEQICNTIIRHGHIYLLQRENGFFIAGASVEHVGFRRDVDTAAAAALERAAAFLMPHLSETSPTEIWNGLRPGGESLHIGAWHSPYLYLAYGHYRNGILLAPATAQRLVAEISANSRTH